MKTPEIPANEPQRLDELHALRLLNTPAEERFDRLTRLAKRLFNVTASVVSLLDADHQWFNRAKASPLSRRRATSPSAVT